MSPSATGLRPHAQDHDQLAYDQLLYNEEEHHNKSQIMICDNLNV